MSLLPCTHTAIETTGQDKTDNRFNLSKHTQRKNKKRSSMHESTSLPGVCVLAFLFACWCLWLTAAEKERNKGRKEGMGLGWGVRLG